MKRTWVKVICLTLALALFGAGVALAAPKDFDRHQGLNDSYELINNRNTPRPRNS